MKTAKATHRDIQALSQGAERNGRLDKATIDRGLDRILKAARQINRQVSSLLRRADSE